MIDCDCDSAQTLLMGQLYKHPGTASEPGH